MREFCTSGSVGAPGEQSPGATRQPFPFGTPWGRVLARQSPFARPSLLAVEFFHQALDLLASHGSDRVLAEDREHVLAHAAPVVGNGTDAPYLALV
jgi:hypothetical protein